MDDAIGFFQGTVAIVAPHMDDEALACGGLIARLPQKESIHIIYATNGMKSPSPVLPGRDTITPDLGEVRVQEAVAAMKLLGLAENNLHFLCLPEANLKKNLPALLESLDKAIRDIDPDIIIMPFRYDRHPDHLAVNHVISAAFRDGRYRARLFEYFVYYRWRLLPRRDVRKYIKPQHLIEVNIDEVSDKKREALDCYKSQTTIYYPWQTRPVLTPILLDEECQNPEIFLVNTPALPGTAVFEEASLWIRMANRLEPVLLRWKYLSGAILKRSIQALYRSGR